MKHVSILVPENAILASLEGTRQLLTQVNLFYKEKRLESLFDVQLVGLKKAVRVSGGLFTVNTTQLIDDVRKTDLIIIPAIDGDMLVALKKNEKFIPWLVKQHKKGAEVASLCLGAFLLASTGLLKGKKCATHWVAENAFRKMFPDVELVTEKIITDDSGFYSSGGAFSYLNLILYLIEKHAGREFALLTAKVFAIEIDRETQLPFTIFNGQKDHEDHEIKQAQDFIEKNYREKISVEQLVSMFALSRRNLERRFKKATSNTVMEYVQRVKIEAAKKQLERNRKNVNDIMYEVGYSDNKAFRSVFKKYTGLSPAEYKSRFMSLA